jgi:hypothetical protein
MSKKVYEVMKRVIDYNVPVVLEPTRGTNKNLNYNPKKFVYVKVDESWARNYGDKVLKEVIKEPKGSKIEIREIKLPIIKATKVTNPIIITKSEDIKEEGAVSELSEDENISRRGRRRKN